MGVFEHVHEGIGAVTRAVFCVCTFASAAIAAQEVTASETAIAPQDPSAVVAPPDEQPTEPPREVRRSPAYEARYHTRAEVEAYVADWLRADRPADGTRVERVELPPNPRGVVAPALQWGAAGDVPLAERPTVVLIGGLDGVSLAGSEAVLAVVAAMLAESAPTLPPDLAFVAIPWASPEALVRTLEGRASDGRDLSPLDDDGDQRNDEDGPDDLDGDEVLLDMLIEDSTGPWVRAADPRFLAPARAGDAPRYQLVREGKDDDHDGRHNEDPPGGVVFDRCFPVGWSHRNSDGSVGHGGSLPLEQAPVRAIADLILARKTVLVLSFQGNHGLLAVPGARSVNPWSADADRRVFESVLESFVRATGRSQHEIATLCRARGIETPGAALDWTYLVPGALALEVAVWGPTVEAGNAAASVSLTDAHFGSQAAKAASSLGAPPASASDQAWARWLDNTRGGIGFVDWHPVELGNGRQALVGGWEPLARVNPPAAGLAAALRGIPAFVTELASSTAHLAVTLPEVRRDREVCTIRARIENRGKLPTGISSTSKALLGTKVAEERYGVRVELELPADARLLAGSTEQWIGHLTGGGASEELSWVVLAAPSSAFTLRVTSPWTRPVVREVKP